MIIDTSRVSAEHAALIKEVYGNYIEITCRHVNGRTIYIPNCSNVRTESGLQWDNNILRFRHLKTIKKAQLNGYVEEGHFVVTQCVAKVENIWSKANL